MCKFRIEYDDQLHEAIEKVDDALKEFGLTIKCDKEFHDGFEIYEIVPVNVI